MLRTVRFFYSLKNFAKRFPDRRRIGEVQHHSAHFGFMRDSSGCKFQYYRVADLFRRLHRFLFVRRHPGFDDGDAVRLHDPLGFEFVQKSPAGCARTVNHIFGQRAIPHRIRSLRQCGSFIKPAQSYRYSATYN